MSLNIIGQTKNLIFNLGYQNDAQVSSDYDYIGLKKLKFNLYSKFEVGFKYSIELIQIKLVVGSM